NYAEAIERQQLGRDDLPRFQALRQAVNSAAPVPEADGFFYFSLFAGFNPARSSCPWLERGADLASDGTVAGCCFMKDEGDRFGSIPDMQSGRVAERRRKLIEQLDGGSIPRGCNGCSTAQAI